MQSVPITTEFVSSIPVNSEVYSIQHYVIKFVRSVVFTNKTDRHDIAEILLKVLLSAITLTLTLYTNPRYPHLQIANRQMLLGPH
jgi:hypothetical protein